LLASEAFAKVSSHSNEMISAFSAITEEIENINGQTKHITEKTGITATTADKINHYCKNLAQNQETVASEISSVNGLFNKAFEEIKEINAGTEEIVKRMAAVGSLSKESYKNMTELENVLEKFKTTSDESEEVQKKIENSTIENIISPELQAQLEADFGNAENSEAGVEFDPSSVVDESSEKSGDDEKTAEKTEDSDFDEMFENIPDENQ
jgi:methyl-accepting chemotaxis protein